MSVFRASRHFSTILTVVIALTIVSNNASGQDNNAPPWGEFLKQFKRPGIDKLLRKPYHMSPDTEVKGLASKLRARELDVPNRKRAIRYLKDLDCTVFPEAKGMLLSMLKPDKEPFEEVRYAAAMGLRDMLAAHSCNPVVRKQAAKAKGKDDDKQPCYCKSCCDADTLNTLAKTAYEMKEDGCCYEPSMRVRQMAVEAIKACGVPCSYKPYYGEIDEEPGPPPLDNSDISTPKTIGPKGEPLPNPQKEKSSSGDSSQLYPLPLPPQSTTQATPIHRLTQICIVSITNGTPQKANPDIRCEYQGRIYCFANEEASMQFQQHPERFAVAFGGCDPVQFVRLNEIVEGRYLASHAGRHYMFATQENHDEFKLNPERYAIRDNNSTVVSNR